jgi:hypothetical protein
MEPGGLDGGELSGRLFLLHEGEAASALDRVAIVEAACVRASTPFVAMDSLSFDYGDLPRLLPGDMLFNAGRGSIRLETILSRPCVATFRTCGATRFTDNADTTAYCAIIETMGLPQPRTIHRLPRDHSGLDRAVQALGGFPVVIKVVGGTMGIGVIVVESMRSLRSIADYLRTTGDEFILRQFIPAAHVARLVVLGDRIIASLKYAVDEQDFRGLPYRMGGREMNFGDEVEHLAREASKAAQYEFTGVDILIDQQGRPHVLEVNAPSNFVALEHDLGVPVGDMIVAHLRGKAERLARAA